MASRTAGLIGYRPAQQMGKKFVVATFIVRNFEYFVPNSDIMMSKVKQWAAMLVIAMGVIGAGSVRVTSFNAEIPAQSQNTIELTWVVQAEQNVKGYRIERKMLSDNFFVPVHTVDANGSGSGTYIWRDTGVFKATSGGEPVVYELYAIYGDDSEQFIDQASVNFTSTAIRRTWGSIKAMFQ